MRHVDEGTLHALLDGALRAEDPARARAVEAHLEGCADCRARLEEAGALTRRAGAILDALEPPAVDADFADVLARRDRALADDGAGHPAAIPAGHAPDAASRDRLRRRGRATRGVAWAASLVLALGTGYLIGDRFGPRPQPSPAAPGTSAARSGAGPGAAAPTSDAGRAAEAGGATADEALLERRVTAEDSESMEARAVPAERGGQGRQREAARSPETRTAAVEEEAASPETQASADDAASRLGVGQPLALESIIVTGVPAGEPAPPTPAPETAAVAAPVASVPDGGANLAETEALRLQSMPVLGAGDAGWRTVDVAEARRLLGGPVLRLPDAELGRLDAGPAGAGGVSVRSVQTLPGGVEVRVTQSRATALDAPADLQARAPAAARAAPSEAAPAPAAKAAVQPPSDAEDAFRTAVVSRGPYLLVVTGPLPVEALRGLAEAASPDPAGPEG